MYTLQYGCFSTLHYLKTLQTNITKEVIDFWQPVCAVTRVKQGPALAREMLCLTFPTTT